MAIFIRFLSELVTLAIAGSCSAPLPSDSRIPRAVPFHRPLWQETWAWMILGTAFLVIAFYLKTKRKR